jgi:hypothetical protein
MLHAVCLKVMEVAGSKDMMEEMGALPSDNCFTVLKGILGLKLRDEDVHRH